MQKQTMADLGATLPIGIPSPDGTLSKGFKLRPFRLKEERELSILREKRHSPPLTLGRFVSHVLAMMVEQVGPHNLQVMSEPERLLLFGSMAMPDVMYMYLQLRKESMGDDVAFKAACGRCKHEWDFTASLSTLEVRVVAAIKEVASAHTLVSGFPYKGEVRKVVKLGVPSWNTMEAQDVTNEGAMKMAIIQAAITGMEGVKQEEFTPLPPTILDEMTKRDAEVLAKVISERTPGPQLAVEADCPKCSHHMNHAINWSYDSFFSASSL